MGPVTSSSRRRPRRGELPSIVRRTLGTTAALVVAAGLATAGPAQAGTAGGATFSPAVSCGTSFVTFSVNSDQESGSYAKLWVYDPVTTQWTTDGQWIDATRWSSFHVADLKNEVLFLRERGEFVGVRGVFGDRFFDQQMFAVTDELLADRVMRESRRGNRGGIHERCKFLKVGHRAGFVFAGRGVGGGRVGVVNGGEFAGVQFGVDAGVIDADVADSDDSDANFWIHEFKP